nr:D627 [uncultured bacterium]
MSGQPFKSPTVALILVCLAPIVLKVSEFVKDGMAKEQLGIHKKASFARVPTEI